MTDAVATSGEAREAAARAGELTGIPWAVVTDRRKDEFCCRDVSFVLVPASRRGTGIVIIGTPGLCGYSPNEGLNMWGAARGLHDLFNDPGVADDLRRLTRSA